MYVSAISSLITLKIIGFSCCNYVYGWFSIELWDEILQKIYEHYNTMNMQNKELKHANGGGIEITASLNIN